METAIFYLLFGMKNTRNLIGLVYSRLWDFFYSPEFCCLNYFAGGYSLHSRR